MSFFMGFPFAGVSRHHDKRIDIWYSNLTMDKLKDLCKAAKLPYSGTKTALISRLSDHDLGLLFVWERSSYHPTGLTNQQLKIMCGERGIAKSGSRYALVHRLFEHSGKAKELSNKKRAPLADVGTARPAKKPRPDKCQVLYNRIQRKIHSGSTNRKYRTHWGAKIHSEDVYELLYQTLGNESKTDPNKNLQVAKALFTSLADNFSAIISPGYDMMEHLSEAVSQLQEIILSALPTLSKEEKVDTLHWVENLQETIALYVSGDGLQDVVDQLVVEVASEEALEAFENEEAEPPQAFKNAISTAKVAPLQKTTKENQLPQIVPPAPKHVFLAAKGGPFQLTTKENQLPQMPHAPKHANSAAKAGAFQPENPLPKIV